MKRGAILTAFTIFSLLCASAQHVEPLFEFALVTDVHISRESTAVEDLERTIASINKNPAIQFVLLPGDLTENGETAVLLQTKKMLDNLNVPYFAVPGNHETKWSESGATDFPKIFGSDRFRFEWQNFVFLAFNSGPIIRMMDGHVGISDLLWLKQELEATDPLKNIIIVTHYPLQSGDVDNWYEVTDLIRQYSVKAVLSGHHHRNNLVSYDGIPAFINRSNLRAKEAVGGYSLFSVTPDSIIVREQLIGQEPRRWGAYSLRTKYFEKDPSGYERPDYSVNVQYPAVKKQWMFRTKAAIYAPPLAYGQRVYVVDDSGFLSCLSLKNGSLLWQFETEGRILGQPAIGRSLVVFGSADGCIYAVDADSGSLRWKVKTGAPVLGAVRIEKGKAYVGGSDRKFRCLDLKTGALLWSYDALGGYVETLPLIWKDLVIFGAWDSYMYALNKKDGSLRWKWNNGNSRMHFSPAAVWPVAAKGKLFFSAPDRTLNALDLKTGKTVWRTKESMVRETIALSADKKRIYSKTMQDSVVCYATSSLVPQKLWSSYVAYGYDHAPTMPVEKGKLFGTTKNGLIFALDPLSGRVIWKHKVGNSLIHVAPIDSNSCLFTNAEGYVGLLVYKEKLLLQGN